VDEGALETTLYTAFHNSSMISPSAFNSRAIRTPPLTLSSQRQAGCFQTYCHDSIPPAKKWRGTRESLDGSPLQQRARRFPPVYVKGRRCCSARINSDWE